MNPWHLAQTECWKHVEVATEMSKVVEKLKDIPVRAVVPIMSAIAPTLVVTPENHSDRDSLRDFCFRLRAAVEPSAKWTSHPSGENWTIRLKLTSGICIDVATSVPAVKITEFLVA